MTWQNPPAKAREVSPLIGYREHDARLESILWSAGFVDEPEAAVFKVSSVQSHVFSQLIPTVGSPAELVLAHHRTVVTAGAQVAASRAGVGAVEQPLMVEIDCFGHRVEQNSLASPGGALTLGCVAQLHAVARRERLDCADEIEFLDLLDKRDRVTAALTTETVVDPFFGVDRQRRGAFTMKRAAGHPIAARTLDVGMFADQRDEIGRGTYLCDVVIVNAHQSAN